MNCDIRDYVAKYPTYKKYEVANPAEPFMVHEILRNPGQMSGMDLLMRNINKRNTF